MFNVKMIVYLLTYANDKVKRIICLRLVAVGKGLMPRMACRSSTWSVWGGGEDSDGTLRTSCFLPCFSFSWTSFFYTPISAKGFLFCAWLPSTTFVHIDYVFYAWLLDYPSRSYLGWLQWRPLFLFNFCETFPSLTFLP